MMGYQFMLERGNLFSGIWSEVIVLLYQNSTFGLEYLTNPSILRMFFGLISFGMWSYNRVHEITSEGLGILPFSNVPNLVALLDFPPFLIIIEWWCKNYKQNLFPKAKLIIKITVIIYGGVMTLQKGFLLGNFFHSGNKCHLLSAERLIFCLKPCAHDSWFKIQTKLLLCAY